MTDMILPINIVLFGPKKAGKTVYLSVLYNPSSSILLTDDATIELLKNFYDLLMEGKRPDATANKIQDLHFRYTGQWDNKEYDVNIDIQDYDGQFAETLSKVDLDEKEKETISSEQKELALTEHQRLIESIRNAEGFIVFLPAESDDEETIQNVYYQVGYFINTVSDMCEGRRIERPLIIAVNKWDKNESFKSPTEDQDARAYIDAMPLYRGIYVKLAKYFAQVDVVPISAYGHKSQDAYPVPGQLAPWRVEEPLARIVALFFVRFQRDMEELQNTGAVVPLCRSLRLYRSQWRRSHGAEVYQQMLETGLKQCFTAYLDKLRACATYKEYQRVSANAEEKEFMEEFSPQQREEIENLEARLQEQCFTAYLDKLRACTTCKEYQRVSANAEEKTLLGEFSPQQCEEIANLEAQILEGQSRRTRRKLWRCAGFFLLCFAVWYLYQSHNAAEKAELLQQEMAKAAQIVDGCVRANHARALLEDADTTIAFPGETLRTLKLFVEHSENLCAAKKCLAEVQSIEDIRQVRAKLTGLPESDTAPILAYLEHVEAKIAAEEEQRRKDEEERRQQKVAAMKTELDQLANVVSACDRRERTERLLQEAQAEEFPVDLRSHLQRHADISTRMCSAETAYGSESSTKEDLDMALAQLEGLTDARAQELRQNIVAKREEVLLKPILAEIEACYDYSTTKAAVEKYQESSHSEIRARVEKLRKKLSTFLREELNRKMARFSDQEIDAEFADLRSYAEREHAANTLTAEDKAYVAAKLQQAVESTESRRVAEMPSRIASMDALRRARALQHQLQQRAGTYRIDGIFDYERPPNLLATLESKEGECRRAENALSGIWVNLTLAGDKNNAVSFDCGKYMDNANITISGGLINKDYKKEHFTCVPRDGGSSELLMGQVLISPKDAYVRIYEDDLGAIEWVSHKNVCTGTLEITEDDILKLHAGDGLIPKYITGCNGLRFIFTYTR